MRNADNLIVCRTFAVKIFSFQSVSELEEDDIESRSCIVYVFFLDEVFISSPAALMGRKLIS